MELGMTQDKNITEELRDDLTTVLESYMDELPTDELFHTAIQFMTYALYQCTDNHREALKILRLAMDAGIKKHVENRKEH